jgi:hypothetical protein
VQSQKSQSLERLERMYKNLDTGMTRNKYLDMCEQLEQEPKDDEIPPDWEDFPEIVRDAINTFNQLGDRVFPEIGYVGKDYANVQYYIEVYDIDDIEFFLEILSWLDSRAIKKSSEELKRQYDKLKRK